VVVRRNSFANVYQLVIRFTSINFGFVSSTPKPNGEGVMPLVARIGSPLG